MHLPFVSYKKKGREYILFRMFCYAALASPLVWRTPLLLARVKGLLFQSLQLFNWANYFPSCAWCQYMTVSSDLWSHDNKWLYVIEPIVSWPRHNYVIRLLVSWSRYIYTIQLMVSWPSNFRIETQWTKQGVDARPCRCFHTQYKLKWISHTRGRSQPRHSCLSRYKAPWLIPYWTNIPYDHDVP